MSKATNIEGRIKALESAVVFLRRNKPIVSAEAKRDAKVTAYRAAALASVLTSAAEYDAWTKDPTSIAWPDYAAISALRHAEAMLRAETMLDPQVVHRGR